MVYLQLKEDFEQEGKTNIFIVFLSVEISIIIPVYQL